MCPCNSHYNLSSKLNGIMSCERKRKRVGQICFAIIIRRVLVSWTHTCGRCHPLFNVDHGSHFEFYKRRTDAQKCSTHRRILNSASILSAVHQINYLQHENPLQSIDWFSKMVNWTQDRIDDRSLLLPLWRNEVNEFPIRFGFVCVWHLRINRVVVGTSVVYKRMCGWIN